jgi:hypothetical protein
MKLWSNNRTYSWIAIVSILLGDVFALIARFSDLHIWFFCLLGIFCLLVTLWIIGRVKNVRFGFKSVIMVKLLSNAAAPHPLSVLYLLLFVLHIGWLGNILASSDNILLSLSVCALLIIFIILFFPSRQDYKDDDATIVLVSGISQINYANLNLAPIVRMLQLVNNADHCDMIILNSKYYTIAKIQDIETQDDTTKGVIKKINRNIEDYFNDYYEKAYNKVDDKTREQFDIVKGGQDVTEKMKLIIRILAYSEFPEKDWILDPSKLVISFTPEEDYDKFNQCFNTLTKYLKEKDDTSHILYFNLTPGTANISALMTLMAIDGDRKLFYYIPENDPQKVRNMSEKEKELRLTEVPKKEMPLKNLLSQAIETLNR